jgi:hypothetical protein
MQIPEELTIFGRTYDVRDVDPIHACEGILGMAAYRNGVIYLDQGMDPSLMLSTLWHEAFHIAQQEILGAADEAQARWVSLFVHTFLLQNPGILGCYQVESNPDSSSDEFPRHGSRA